MKKRKYNLVGVDGNAFSVMGYVAKAMENEGKTEEEVEAYQKEAMSGNYTHLLATSLVMVDELNSIK